MNKLPLTIIILFISNCTIFCQDFRNAYWGQSISEVKLNEKSEFQGEYDQDYLLTLLYNGTLGNFYDASIMYQFVDKILVSGGYDIFSAGLEKTCNPDISLYYYSEINKTLKNKYKTISESEVWSEPLYKDVYESLGKAMAIESGVLTLKTIYESETTKIVHLLVGDGTEVHHFLYYHSKKYSKEFENAQDKEGSDGF